MVGVPMPESESFSCSDPKVPDAQIRNSEVIKHTKHRHAVEAVHNGREVHLAGGDAELGHVGDPQPVGLVGMEAVPARSSRSRFSGASEISPSYEL